MNNTSIGWIGLGIMGTPMAQQLLQAGYSVTVYNRDKSKEQELLEKGAGSAATPAELLQHSNIVFLMVSDDLATREIFNGKDGLLSAGLNGRLMINMSTVSPGVSREMAALCAKQGNTYLDAPVSGSVKQAMEGQLVIMVGGDAAAFETSKPILEKMGKMAHLLGETGAGNTAKLAINAMLAIHAQGLAEALIFAEENGVNTADLMTLLNNGALANPFIKIKGDAILNNNFKAAFSLKHMVKDLGLAKEEGLHTSLGNAAYESFKLAAKTYGEEDLIAIYKHLKTS